MPLLMHNLLMLIPVAYVVLVFDAYGTVSVPCYILFADATDTSSVPVWFISYQCCMYRVLMLKVHSAPCYVILVDVNDTSFVTVLCIEY